MPSDRTDEQVAVLVPAAGRGTRLGGRQKQFRRLGGRPLLVQTLRVFERHPDVAHLVVAAPAGKIGGVGDRLRAEGITRLAAVVEGGASRAASVAAALEAVPPEAGIVLVHDAVRPFIAARHVSAVIEAVRAHGAAALAAPVADTLRRGEEECFAETVPRQGLYRMQTPQGFRRRWLEEAHARAAAAGDAAATDDVELVQRLGYPVRIVAGSEHNVKITTAGDWALARAFWPRWEERSRR